MRICLIGSKNIFIYNFARYYAEVKHFEVFLISRYKENYTTQDFSFIKVYHLKNNRLITKVRSIRKIIKEINPNVVHNFYLARDAIAPLLFLKRKYKYIVSIFGSDIYWDLNTKTNWLIKNYILRKCNFITFNSLKMKEDLLMYFPSLNPEKIRPIIWGINFNLFNKPDYEQVKLLKLRYGINSEINILSYRGFAEVYNQEMILKSIPYVISEIPEAKFIFVTGKTKLTEIDNFTQLIKQLKVESHILLIEGYLQQSELSCLLSLSTISLSIPKTDQIAQTLLETMAANCIPVISDLSVYKEIVKDGVNAFTVSPLNEKKLAEVIKYALKHSEKNKEAIVSINNEIIKEKFDFVTQTEKIINLYKET